MLIKLSIYYIRSVIKNFSSDPLIVTKGWIEPDNVSFACPILQGLVVYILIFHQHH